MIPRRIIRNGCASSRPRPSRVVDYFVGANAWPVRKIDADGNMDQIFRRDLRRGSFSLSKLAETNAMAIQLKSPSEIAKLREANLIVAEVLDALEAASKPGVATWELNGIAAGQAEAAQG